MYDTGTKCAIYMYHKVPSKCPAFLSTTMIKSTGGVHGSGTMIAPPLDGPDVKNWGGVHGTYSIIHVWR